MDPDFFAEGVGAVRGGRGLAAREWGGECVEKRRSPGGAGLWSYFYVSLHAGPRLLTSLPPCVLGFCPGFSSRGALTVPRGAQCGSPPWLSLCPWLCQGKPWVLVAAPRGCCWHPHRPASTHQGRRFAPRPEYRGRESSSVN